MAETGVPLARKRANFNTVAALVFIVFAIALFLIIPYQIDKPLILLGASQSNLPAEMFPQIISGVFLVLGIWFLVRSFTLRQKNELVELDREGVVNVTITLVAMAIYVVLMVDLGFVVGSAIMVFGLSTYYGNRNYLLAAAVSIAVPMAIFFVFRHFLLTELPPFPIDIYPLTHWSLI